MSPKNTAKMWPDESPEQVVARVRAADGDAMADLVERLIAADPQRRPGFRTTDKWYEGDRRSRKYGVLPRRGHRGLPGGNR